MDEKVIEKRGEMELDFKRLLDVLLNKAWLIGIVAVVAAVVVFLGTLFFITPKYESSAMFYVNNSALSIGGMVESITSSDLTAAKGLVDSYIVILTTRESLNDVIDYSGVDRTVEELRKMIKAAPVNSTEIFEVVVTSTDPVEAEKIADAIAYILPNRIKYIIEGSSAKVVDSAVLPSEPSSPSYLNNAIIGFLLGLVGCISVIVLREIFDITIRTEEDITQNCPHPILASVPDMTAGGKGGYGHYYGYGSKSRAVPGAKEPVMVGQGMSFAASEAYKLLRTKLQFSFAGDGECRVIGVSSAMAGEGKSLSSINVAYSMSQLGKKVLLIDCDMRRPSLATKLKIEKYPGLSNYLTGLNELEELLQNCGIEGEEDAFQVVTAGRNPPNPVELLSSTKMSDLLVSLRQTYDYVILDLPPVGEVSDALALAKEMDGLLLVVRQNYCNRLAVRSAVRQFAFMDSRILGVVYNATTEGRGAYGKKYYKRYGYGKYYRGYYHYGYYRASAEKEANGEQA